MNKVSSYLLSEYTPEVTLTFNVFDSEYTFPTNTSVNFTLDPTINMKVSSDLHATDKYKAESYLIQASRYEVKSPFSFSISTYTAKLSNKLICLDEFYKPRSSLVALSNFEIKSPFTFLDEGAANPKNQFTALNIFAPVIVNALSVTADCAKVSRASLMSVLYDSIMVRRGFSTTYSCTLVKAAPLNFQHECTKHVSKYLELLQNFTKAANSSLSLGYEEASAVSSFSAVTYNCSAEISSQLFSFNDCSKIISKDLLIELLEVTKVSSFSNFTQTATAAVSKSLLLTLDVESKVTSPLQTLNDCKDRVTSEFIENQSFSDKVTVSSSLESLNDSEDGSSFEMTMTVNTNG